MLSFFITSFMKSTIFWNSSVCKLIEPSNRNTKSTLPFIHSREARHKGTRWSVSMGWRVHAVSIIRAATWERFLLTESPAPYPDNQGALAAQDPSDSGGKCNTSHLGRHSGHTSEIAQDHMPEGSKCSKKGVGWVFFLCVFWAPSAKNKNLQSHHPLTSLPTTNRWPRQGNSASTSYSCLSIPTTKAVCQGRLTAYRIE